MNLGKKDAAPAKEAARSGEREQTGTDTRRAQARREGTKV